jgi:hypothetical protein
VDVRAKGLKGEAHFGWALEGRAIQDIWIMPRLAERTSNLDKHMNMYGTTLRVWDPAIQAWRITWINPAGDHREEQIGRWSGKDVVQVGMRPDGTPTLDVLRDYRRFVPLDRRSDESRWSHVETRGRLPCDSDALKTDLRGTRFTFSGLT